MNRHRDTACNWNPDKRPALSRIQSQGAGLLGDNSRHGTFETIQPFIDVRIWDDQ
ncbi:hypothetical protein HNQ59_000256 [Chitinivorax tropicus]|uniref:Uncharacterized protein n=1 Tax=Chitinivorax tropicus TaxID=714531 RepID=A0A840MCF2_9PROT|nr:hypothetical protein [Chitinivorax tropicus]